MNGPLQFSSSHPLVKRILVANMITEINTPHSVTVFTNEIQAKKIKVGNFFLYLVPNYLFIHHPIEFLKWNGK